MIVRIIRNLRDWFRYERLHHYPELEPFSREEALKRLKRYEAEERQRWMFWIRASMAIRLFSLVPMVVLLSADKMIAALIVLGSVHALSGMTQYWLHCRIRERVGAKVAAELRDGRLWTCVECGYDLRGNTEICSECGATVQFR